ncbi:MAG: HU family DNA-binding protein, partial [Candidatus Vogelbacteria bacterium]|nr:HU family DNA-binding protein [Candidatus Vogelbacteria bacterium]
MNKQALVELIHENIGGTKAGAEKVMDIIIDSIISTLKKGDDVSIAGLGIFSANVRKAREARNPRTGDGDTETMLQILKVFWKAVANVFPEAWGLPPNRSRLMHGAGIIGMGLLMD